MEPAHHYLRLRADGHFRGGRLRSEGLLAVLQGTGHPPSQQHQIRPGQRPGHQFGIQNGGGDLKDRFGPGSERTAGPGRGHPAPRSAFPADPAADCRSTTLRFCSGQ